MRHVDAKDIDAGSDQFAQLFYRATGGSHRGNNLRASALNHRFDWHK
jgi:hypothetical protein